MKLTELSELITVRDFAARNYDNVYFKMSTDEIKLLRNKINFLDRIILDELLKLNPLSDKVSGVKEIQNEDTKQSASPTK